MRRLGCVIVGSVHELNWGGTNDDDTVWLGLTGIKDEVDEIITMLEDDLPDKITAKFGSWDFM